MNELSDTTPNITRTILLAVLTITAAAFTSLLFDLVESGNAENIAALLWLFTCLFVLRVGGQMLVALRPRQWLPPMYQWNFIPYPILLPIQLVFIVVMVWINVSFTSNIWSATGKSSSHSGDFLIGISAVYMLAMVIRYVRRMYRHPDQRWFGGTIPIVFHIVLATYLYTLGSFYVSP